MQNDLIKFKDTIDSNFIELVDPKSAKNIITNEYYVMDKRSASKLYESIGLFNHGFVNNLFKLDSVYALEKMNQLLRRSGIEFSIIGSELFVKDTAREETYNCMVDIINEYPGIYMSKQVGKLETILDLDGSHLVYILFDIVDNNLRVYDIEKTDSRLYILSDFVRIWFDEDWLQLLKCKVNDRNTISYVYDWVNSYLTYTQLMTYSKLLGKDVPDDICHVYENMNGYTRRHTDSPYKFSKFLEDMHDVELNVLMENFKTFYDIYENHRN